MSACLDAAVQPLFIHTDEVPRWLERVRPHLIRMAAGSGGKYEAEDIAATLISGRMELWVAMEGPELLCVMVTEQIRYPRLTALRAVGIVGHQHRKWVHLFAEVERAARDALGCKIVQAFVQPGHERLLTTGGWELSHSMWEKAL